MAAAIRLFEVDSHIAIVRPKRRDIAFNQFASNQPQHALCWNSIEELFSRKIGWRVRLQQVCDPEAVKELAAERFSETIIHIVLNLAACRLELASVSASNRLDYFKDGEWYPLGLAVDSRSATNKQYTRGSSALTLKRARESIRVCDEQEFEIIVSRMEDHTRVLRRAVESCLSLLTALEEAKFFQKWTIQIPSKRIENIFMPNPNPDAASLAGLPALMGSKHRIVTVERFLVKDEDNRGALEQTYKAPKKWSGVQGVQNVIETFYENMEQQSLAFRGIYYVVTPPNLGNFNEIDWVAIDRDTRFALFFTSLVGLYNLHEDNCIHEKKAATASNMFVVSLSAPAPEAVISGFAPITHKQARLVVESKLEDIRWWALAITQVVATIYGYGWSSVATHEHVVKALRFHQLEVPEDRELVTMLSAALKHLDTKELKTIGARRARHLLRFPCWKPGLGERWSGLYEAFHDQFPFCD